MDDAVTTATLADLSPIARSAISQSAASSCAPGGALCWPKASGVTAHTVEIDAEVRDVLTELGNS
jgi:hypothetical protein